MNYQRINVIAGWGIWLVATIVYLSTIEPTASFWDCGEFIASAYKLEVGHPPGAPLFMLLARFFSMFAPTGYEATAVNMLSAVCSSFTILFLFWSITYLAKKMAINMGGELDKGKIIAVIGSGAIGALAYTFSDSFWFSAVEGEVYAMSSLFTAMVFWAILKWEEQSDGISESRWIILIAYLMGLSIGVHLLNLLAIPAIAFVYYFKRHSFSWLGVLITGASSLAILGFIQTGIIQGFFKLAGKFELFFVNKLGMAFNSGVIVYGIVVAVVLAAAIWFSRKKQLWGLNIFALSILVILIGYSTFALIPIRSSANPPMDENNPENLFTLLSYLNREQYGDRPLLFGQYFSSPTDRENPYKDGNPSFVKSYSVKIDKSASDVMVRSFRWEYEAKKYIEENPNSKHIIVEEYVDSGEKKGSVPNYDPEYCGIFPRMYSSQANHLSHYKRWSNYNNYNVTTPYTSPFSDYAMDRGSFTRHIDIDIIGGNLADPKLVERSLRKLFGEYKVKFDEDFKLRSANEILVRNPESGEFDQIAKLDSPEMREAIIQYMVDILDQHVEVGPAYVSRLEENKRQLEGGIQYLIQEYNRTSNSELLSRIRSYEKRLADIEKDLIPTFAEDMTFFARFQVNWMYFRYFLWNFAGRQNDIQGHGDFMTGNWLSGVDFIDEERLGSRELLPSSELNNKGFNKFYYIPLLLGIIGLLFHLLRAPKDFSIVALLFLATGLAIVVYLNQYPMQPRERDYAYVGSFYAFAIWIGLGVFALYYATMKMSLKELGILGAMTLGTSILIFGLESIAGQGHVLGYTLIYMTVITLAVMGVAVLLRTMNVSSFVKASVVSVICLTAPVVMAIDGWDDHNRAKRKTGVDFAKNYLDSLEPNAILFTNGDNDTFPLWYIQEVENYRTDVRVVNLSLLNTDWYIDQMKRKAYTSDPVPFKMDEYKYRQGTRDIVLLEEPTRTNKYIDLASALDVSLDDAQKKEFGDGKSYAYLPSHSFRLPVDSAKVANLGFLSDEELEKMVDNLEWTIADERGNPKRYILKNHYMVLELLKHNNWERPVYFAVTTGPDSYVGLSEYFRLEGLAYRLIPVKHPNHPNPNILGGIATDLMYKHVMEDWQWGNMDYVEGDGIYMDENNRRMTTNLRLQLSNLSEELMNENKNSKALDIIDKMIEVTPFKNVPIDRIMLPAMESLFELSSNDSLKTPYAANSDLSNDRKLEAKELAEEVAQLLFTKLEEEVTYYTSLDKKFYDQSIEDLGLKIQVNQRIAQVVNFYYPNSEFAKELEGRIDGMMQQVELKEQGLIDLGQVEF